MRIGSRYPRAYRENVCLRFSESSRVTTSGIATRSRRSRSNGLIRCDACYSRASAVAYLIFELRYPDGELLGFGPGHNVDAQGTAFAEMGPNVHVLLRAHGVRRGDRREAPSRQRVSDPPGSEARAKRLTTLAAERGCSALRTMTAQKIWADACCCLKKVRAFFLTLCHTRQATGDRRRHWRAASERLTCKKPRAHSQHATTCLPPVNDLFWPRHRTRPVSCHNVRRPRRERLSAHRLAFAAKRPCASTHLRRHVLKLPQTNPRDAPPPAHARHRSFPKAEMPTSRLGTIPTVCLPGKGSARYAGVTSGCLVLDGDTRLVVIAIAPGRRHKVMGSSHCFLLSRRIHGA